MTKDFYDSNIAPLLRQFGNLRLPYLIFVDKNVISKANKYLMLLDRTMHQMDIALFSANALQSLSDKYDVVIATGDYDFFEKRGYKVLFNEIHCSCDSIEQFKSVFKYNDVNVFVRQAIKLHELRAYQSNGIVINGIKAEPYHTLGHVLNSDVVILYVWDTREIVAIERRNDINWINYQDANDNQRLLYCHEDLTNYPELKQITISIQ